jgi:hypothetical protein
MSPVSQPVQSPCTLPAEMFRYAMVCAVLFVAGCGRPQQNLPPVPALPPNDTVEGKLARVMQRLDSAITDAQAATGSGVVSERVAYERLIKPQNESDPYEAVVTIETTRALAPIAINAAAQAKAEAKARKEGRDLTDEEAKKLVVQDTQSTEVEEYALIYDGSRWKLKNELPQKEGESMSIEQILFDYALDVN